MSWLVFMDDAIANSLQKYYLDFSLRLDKLSLPMQTIHFVVNSSNFISASIALKCKPLLSVMQHL
jgi:hypothetical protein